jgi:hypothetical protein
MALIAATNHDFQASGMGIYPLSAKPFCPAPMLTLLPFPHHDKISALKVRTPSAPPHGLSFNSVPNGGDQTSLLVGAAGGRSAVFLAAMKLTATRLTFGEFTAIAATTHGTPPPCGFVPADAPASAQPVMPPRITRWR